VRVSAGVAISVGAALCLGACARDPYVSQSAIVKSGSWRIETQTDRVTGLPVSSAIVTAMASNTNVMFPQPASLQLLCFIGKPIATFRFDFKIGNDRSSFLGYRFDDKPGHEIGGQFVASAMSVAIEEPAEVAQFVKDLSTSRTLYVRIRSLSAGRTAAEFKVDGAPDAIASAYAKCPVKPPEPPQKVAARTPARKHR